MKKHKYKGSSFPHLKQCKVNIIWTGWHDREESAANSLNKESFMKTIFESKVLVLHY